MTALNLDLMKPQGIEMSQDTSSTDQQKKTHFPNIDAQQHFVCLIFR